MHRWATQRFEPTLHVRSILITFAGAHGNVSLLPGNGSVHHTFFQGTMGWKTDLDPRLHGDDNNALPDVERRQS